MCWYYKYSLHHKRQVNITTLSKLWVELFFSLIDFFTKDDQWRKNVTQDHEYPEAKCLFLLFPFKVRAELSSSVGHSTSPLFLPSASYLVYSCKQQLRGHLFYAWIELIADWTYVKISFAHVQKEITFMVVIRMWPNVFILSVTIYTTEFCVFCRELCKKCT